jgi:amidase
VTYSLRADGTEKADGSAGTDSTGRRTFTLAEATIADMQEAMGAGAVSSVELTALSLNRIFAYDSNGMRLNAIPVLNPDVLAEAAEADRLRAIGVVHGDLHGVPFTVKDSYKVKGLTVACGSPAFAGLIANEDSFAVERIRSGGGVLIGKTTMPPLATGGMQRGLYGRAESPYNPDFLTAAWDSGSSNGCGTATAASFAAFGLGEETTSSGRSPASNNALVAYTPSRGLISIRGNWPLFPIKDVVVPMTRTVTDMFALLNTLVVEDPIVTGDFWREQSAVPLPTVDSVRPEDYRELAEPDSLRGKRIGVPTQYIGKDYSGSAPFSVRPSIRALWEQAAEDLRSLGATVVEVDFEAIHNYEEDRVTARGPVERDLLPGAWWRFTDYETGTTAGTSLEFTKLNPFWSERFLRLNNDPSLSSWRDVDVSQVFPYPPGTVDASRKGPCRDYGEMRAAIVDGYQSPWTLPELDDALRGAERLRAVDFEHWLTANDLDLLVFPANADVGRADSDVNEESYLHASSNGVRCSNGNFMLRHLGIPSVSVSMGLMADIGMPVNLTFAGPAYTDSDLLSYAYAYERYTQHRRAPTRVPPLPEETIHYDRSALIPPVKREHTTPPALTLSARIDAGELRIAGTLSATSDAEVTAWVNGMRVPLETDGARWSARVPLAKFTRPRVTLAGRLAILALAKDIHGNAAAALEQVDAPTVR